MTKGKRNQIGSTEEIKSSRISQNMIEIDKS